jgi:hypothetical protein
MEAAHGNRYWELSYALGEYSTAERDGKKRSAYYCTPKCLFFDLGTMVFAFAYLPQHFGFGLV